MGCGAGALMCVQGCSLDGSLQQMKELVGGVNVYWGGGGVSSEVLEAMLDRLVTALVMNDEWVP